MQGESINSFKFQMTTAGAKRKRRLDTSGDFITEDQIDEENSRIITEIQGPQSFKEPLSVVKEKKLLVIPLTNEFSRNKSISEDQDQNIHEKVEKNLDMLAAEEIMNEISSGTSKKENPTRIIESMIPSSSLSSSTTERKQPLLLANIASELKGLTSDEERFKRDMLLRAEDMDVKSDRYKSVPIEEFGAALLRGMGWAGPTDEDKERMKKAEEPMMARDGRLGLGAVGKPPEDKKNGKHGNKAKNKEEWSKKVEDSLKKQTLNVGDLVWLRIAMEASKRAQVIAVKGVPGLDKIRIRMETDGRVLEVSRLDAVLLTESALEEKPYLAIYKDIPDGPQVTEYKGISNQSDKKRLDDSKSSSKHKQHQQQQSSSNSSSSLNSHKDQEKQHKSYESWLYPTIRVRIISKHMGDRVYLQKGTIVDVHSSGYASIRLDDGSFFDSVKEKYLETVLPSTQGICKILRGEYRGQQATLLEKKKEVDRAIVQLLEDFEVIELSMDDLAAVASSSQ